MKLPRIGASIPKRDVKAERDTLKASLAEAVALLREWDNHEPLARHCQDPVIEGLSRKVAALLRQHQHPPEGGGGA